MSVVVRVLPDVTTFAVDAGFSYVVPDDLEVGLGSLVRIPLGGRTVRGWVIDVEDAEPEGLRPIKRVSGTLRIFDEVHLRLFRWLAHHYVAPLAAIIRGATPPNLTTRVPRRLDAPSAPVHAGRSHYLAEADLVERLAASEGSSLVVVPSAIDLERWVEALAMAGGPPVVAVAPDAAAAAVTKAWSTARLEPGHIVIGTPRIASWPVADLRRVAVVDDGRRGHKDRRTPTLHSRTVLSQRTRLEKCSFMSSGLVPTLEVLAAGGRVQPATKRPWSLVEVVDRNEEPPGRGVLSERVKQAVRGAVNDGRRVFVFSHRRGYAPAFRCVACGDIRKCRGCGSAASATGVCPRCGATYGPCLHPGCGGRSFEPLGAAVGRLIDLLRRMVGDAHVGEVGDGGPVVVGTERDIPDVGAVALCVVVDADRLLLGTNYRAAEDALRLLARVGSLPTGDRGSRLMIQTAVPDHGAIEALRRGDATEFLASELERRAAAGMPPRGELIVLEVRGDGHVTDEELESTEKVGAVVFGPMATSTGHRWLIQGQDLGRTKLELRSVVRRLRDTGNDVRVDVDPVDL